MKSMKYEEILDSLRKKGCIDDEVCYIVTSFPLESLIKKKGYETKFENPKIEKIQKRRLAVLRATGLTLKQESLIETTYSMLVKGSSDAKTFDHIYGFKHNIKELSLKITGRPRLIDD